ncbi:MAG TPA: EamA family transporter [Clostridia bacterium]|nr:EamA family transporter [Clostridia bacterium]
MKDATLFGYLLVFLAAVTWGTSGLFFRGLNSAGIGPLSAVFWRSGLMAVVCFCVWMLVLWSGRRNGKRTEVPSEIPVFPNTRNILRFALLGFINIVPVQYLFAYSVLLTSVAVAVTLQYTAPFFVTVLSRLVYKEPITPLKMAGLVISVSGLALAVGLVDLLSGGASSVSPLAIAVGLTSGFFYGLYTLLLKGSSTEHHPIYLTMWVMTFGALSASIVALVGGEGIRVPSGPAPWGLVVLLSLLPGVLGFCLYTAGLARVESSRASIIATVEPVAAGFFAFLFWGEMVSVTQAVGMVMVIAGVISVGLDGKLKRNFVPSCVYAEQKADAYKVGHHRATSIAHEGQGQPGHGHKA